MSHFGQHRKTKQQQQQPPPQHSSQQQFNTWTKMLLLLLLPATALLMTPNAASAALLTDHNDYDDDCSQVECPAMAQCPADSAPWSLLPFDDSPPDYGHFKVLDAGNPFADALIEQSTAATPATTSHSDRSKRALIYADSLADGAQSLTERQLRLCCGQSAAQQCQCKPCAPMPKCGPNTVAVELHKGSGQPGDCCSSYVCVPRQQCGDGAQSYWRDQCTRCNCHGVRELCHNICPNDEEAIGDESADQHKGCYSAYWQEPKSHGSSWPEDDYCTQCTCNNGERECIAKMCAPVACKRPTKIKGQCCPLCLPHDDEAVEGPQTEPAIEMASEVIGQREDKSLNINTTVSAADTTTTTTPVGNMTSGATESTLAAQSSSTHSEAMSGANGDSSEATTIILDVTTQDDEKTSTATANKTITTTTTSVLDTSSSQSMSPQETASTPADDAIGSTKIGNTSDTTFATAQPASSTETTRKTDTTDQLLELQARGGASTATASASNVETSTSIRSSSESTTTTDAKTLSSDSAQATQSVATSTTQTAPTGSVEPNEAPAEVSTSTVSETYTKSSSLSTTTAPTSTSSPESSISTSSPLTTTNKPSTSHSTPAESYSTSSPAGSSYSSDSTSTTYWLSTLSFTTSAPAPPAPQPTVYQPIVSILHDPHFQIGIVVAIVFGVCCVLGFGIWKFYTPKRGNAVLKRYTFVPSTETSWSHSPTSSNSSMA